MLMFEEKVLSSIVEELFLEVLRGVQVLARGLPPMTLALGCESVVGAVVGDECFVVFFCFKTYAFCFSAFLFFFCSFCCIVVFLTNF